MSITESWKKIKAGAADLAEQSKQALDTAVEKSKGLAEQGKLSLENQKQAQIIADAQQQIGVYVSENNLLGDDEFVLGQMSVIAAAQEIQEKNNARISELKNAEKAEKEKAEERSACACNCEKEVHVCEPHFCPKCGAQVRADAVYCQTCGVKL